MHNIHNINNNKIRNKLFKAGKLILNQKKKRVGKQTCENTFDTTVIRNT